MIYYKENRPNQSNRISQRLGVVDRYTLGLNIENEENIHDETFFVIRIFRYAVQRSSAIFCDQKSK